ncbi:hypothetical protein ACVIKP_000255 [Rhizobium leguminosarum]
MATEYHHGHAAESGRTRTLPGHVRFCPPGKSRRGPDGHGQAPLGAVRLSGRRCSLQSIPDRQPRLLGLFVPTLLIASETNKMKVFEATISALACGLDVIPCGQVFDRGKLTAFAVLVTQSGKNHSRVANTALSALKLKCSSLASVFVLRELAQTTFVLLQGLDVVAKMQTEPLSIPP